MDLEQVIRERRTIRSFQHRPVPREVLERVLQAAIWAPNPSNSQAWRFDIVVGKKRDELVKIISQYPTYMADILATYPDYLRQIVLEFSQDLGGAPAIVVVSIPTLSDTHIHKIDLIGASCAVQNLQLTAWNEGLGCVCLTSALWVEADIARYLGLTQREIVTVVPVGYPAVVPPPLPRQETVINWVGLNGSGSSIPASGAKPA